MDGTTKKDRTRGGKVVLVAGGAGFLGSHLCRRLLEAGHQVSALDNLVTGRLHNITSMLANKAFRFIRHDVTEPFQMRADWVFNFACCASPVHYQADPVKTMRTCVDGAINMLQLAQDCGARIFQASTSEVYGEPEVHPQPESYRGAVNTIGPRSCYDEGKRSAETLFFDFQRTHGTEIKVARIFNTYGPSMRADDGRVVSNLLVQALRNEPLTIHGDGSQTRSFCYVDDLIDGIVALMESPAEITGPMNLGNPGEVTMIELARRILDITGSRSRLVHRSMPEDDPTRRRPDITLARQALGWAPRIELDDGLRRTAAWFERNLDSVQSQLEEEECRGVA